jgi:hypothetical protein
MRGHPAISSIYQRANADPPRGEQAQQQTEAAKQRAWQEFGLLVVDPEDINDDWLRQALINTASKLYGRRKGRRK